MDDLITRIVKSFLCTFVLLFILLGCSEILEVQKDTKVSRKSEVLPTSRRSIEVVSRLSGPLKHQLSQKGFKIGSPIFLQIFKEESALDLWIQEEGSQDYRLFKTYPICNFSGQLGPKQKEGDHQSPEGFYEVKPSAMNPNSAYHLSFNLGFPNRYDQSHGRTGSYLMVHGNCVSIGCYAMGDDQIEELYTLAEAALRGGQKTFSVHAFPFRMTQTKLESHKNSRWYEFWKNLKEGYDAFEVTRKPPTVTVASGRYKITSDKDIQAVPEVTTFRDGRFTIDSDISDTNEKDEGKAAAEWNRIKNENRR